MALERGRERERERWIEIEKRERERERLCVWTVDWREERLGTRRESNQNLIVDNPGLVANLIKILISFWICLAFTHRS